MAVVRALNEPGLAAVGVALLLTPAAPAGLPAPPVYEIIEPGFYFAEQD